MSGLSDATPDEATGSIDEELDADIPDGGVVDEALDAGDLDQPGVEPEPLPESLPQ